MDSHGDVFERKVSVAGGVDTRGDFGILDQDRNGFHHLHLVEHVIFDIREHIEEEGLARFALKDGLLVDSS